ncbi:MAG: PKD domain-containing protein [Gammaproteobacteria bacterium]|nr:PKD domain-containing protein [Gammaproteobacteria bacterium]
MLILWDDPSVGTQALQTALLNAGFEVFLSENSESEFNGANPLLDDFNVVIHLNGTSHGRDMPLSGQQALVDYVRYGGGYIHSAWNAYEYYFGGIQLMRDLILFDRITGECYQERPYYRLESAEIHPILANVPQSFSFSGGFNVGPLHLFETNPSTVLMRIQSDAAVAVRELGRGHIVAFNHSGNYAECTGDIPHLNAYVQQLYVDAAHWVAGTVVMNSLSAVFNSPPIAVADGVAPLECSAASSADVTLQGGNSSDPDGDSLAYFWTWLDGQAVGVSPTAIFSLGVTEVTLLVDDGQGLTASEQTLITVQDSVAPVVSAGLDQVLEANSPAGAAFDLASQASATDGCCEVSLVTPLGQYALGQHRLTATALDCADNLGRDSMLLTVVDRTPPLLSAALVRVRFVDDDEDEDEGENHEDEHDEDEKDDEKQRFRVQFNASDLVDLNPVLKAELWVVGYEKPIMVSNGQLIEFEYEDDESEVEFEEGLLEVEAAGMMLRVSAVDASGNRSVVEDQVLGWRSEEDGEGHD